VKHPVHTHAVASGSLLSTVTLQSVKILRYAQDD
jgi:hypothetical protein